MLDANGFLIQGRSGGRPANPGDSSRVLGGVGRYNGSRSAGGVHSAEGNCIESDTKTVINAGSTDVNLGCPFILLLMSN